MDEKSIDASSETLADEADVTSSDGVETVDDTVASAEDQSGVSLEELNKIMGTEFKDKDTALKAIKDTKDYVGKAGQVEKQLKEQLENATDADQISHLQEQVKAIQTESFYARHPEYEPYKDAITAMGENPADVVGSDAFKVMYEKAKGYDETQQSKSVLETNPRLNQVRDRMTKAREDIKASREALQHGDMAGSFAAAEAANSAAIDSVVEAFELGR